MPYNIIDLIESDETMSTCQMFNAEVCYGSGLVYDTELATAQVQAQVDDFMLDNDLASYFLGVCQDFKHFGFCVSVIILNEDASRIVRIVRKQACYSTTSRLQTPSEQYLQGRGHHESCQAAGTCQRGEGQHHQLPYWHGEQWKGTLLYILCFTQR